MFITPAYAQAGAPAPDPLMTFLPFILIFIIMYFLLIRPQQKRLKEHRAMIEALKRGDRVVSAGGMIGKVTAVGPAETDEVTVEISNGVNATFVKSTITAVLSKTEPAKTK